MSTVSEYWQELVTASLLGTDRRDPPDPPVGPLADVVADAVTPTPSERMLAAVGACTVARRAGLLPRPSATPLVPPADDDRPLVPPAASRRWCSVVVNWPVLEDEWLTTVEQRGWRLPPDVLVGLLRRHRNDGPRRARVIHLGGPLVSWLIGHQPQLAAPGGRRPGVGGAAAALPDLPVPPALLALLTAPADVVVAAVVGGLLDGTLAVPHRAVLVNFIARVRSDALAPLADAMGELDPQAASVGLAHALADLASTRQAMLEELAP